MQYLILDGKTPTHKFKDGVGIKNKSEVKGFENVGMIVPPGYVVYDFDTASDADIMLKIVDGLNINTRVMRTTRGIHCWFKSPEDNPKNFIKNRLAIGIYSDRKAGGRNAYVKIKQDGKNREWIRKKCKLSDVDVAPAWLRSVSAPGDQFKFKDMGDGSGRNQELFNYIVYLQGKKFKRDEIREIIQIINSYVLVDPLSDFEIATICRDEAFKPDDVIEEQIEKAEKKAGFNHIDIGESLIEKYHLIKYNDIIYGYENGYYRPADYLRKYIRDEFIGIKNAQVSEVVSYISDMKMIRREDVKIDPYIINLNNTRLDIRTGVCIDFDPMVYEFNRIPVNYDPSAHCEDLDKMLNKVFCGDRGIIDLFEEIFGYTLIRHARYQKGFLFIGGGSNGKSTVLNLIKAFYGPGNYSAIPLERVTERFNTIQLEHMFCNIGDDVDNKTVKDTGTLKKLFSGDALLVERKGETPYSTELPATHIYSANVIPKSFDKSDGFYRRFVLIPFNAKLSPDDEDYDPNIVDKITTPEALSYLLNIGIRGAQRLMKRGKFTETQSVIDVLEQYKKDNSTVLSWIDDAMLDEDYFLIKPKEVLYSEFSDWCKVSGIKSDHIPKRNTFYKEITIRFDFDSKAKQRTDGKRYFMQKL